MFGPLTSVLIKIFAKGFYRVHAGLLLFFFITVISYCFFIEVLNQTHFRPEEIILFNLIFVLSLLTSPVLVAVVFFGWFIFVAKSWKFISQQLSLPSNQFLFYSSTSIVKREQFKSWLLLHLVISLPMIGYGVFALVIGVIFGHYIVPAVIFFYVLVLSGLSAWIQAREVNTLIKANRQSLFLRLTWRWPKPLFSLFLYYVLDRLKGTFFITKAITGSIIIASMYLFKDLSHDLRIGAIVTLGIITAHSILIYQSHKFENTYLSFARNFPYSKWRRYTNCAFAYLLLTIPESVWLFTTFEFLVAISLFTFKLSTAMLLRTLLYRVALQMKKYLYWVFYLFNIMFLIILFNQVWLLIPATLVISIILFYSGYYRFKSTLL